MHDQESYTNRIKSGLELPWWFTREMPRCNDDFTQRVVNLPQHAKWHATQVPGVDLRVLEYVSGAKPRLTAQLRLAPEYSPALLGDNPDLEILVQRGELESAMGIYPGGLYLRLPLSDDARLQALTVRCSPDVTTQRNQQRTSSGEKPLNTQPKSALIYLAAGQMLTSDTEQRRLNTRDESRWLPGPVAGTDVMPLHGHGTGNVMLIRWNNTTAFKPRLDPRGEEVLVLQGSVHDSQGHYPAGSWIRNPVATWQSWGAHAGTLVYYKNGHFAVNANSL